MKKLLQLNNSLYFFFCNLSMKCHLIDFKISLAFTGNCTE